MKRGDTLQLEIETFADKGKGLARVDGLVVFVREGVPGDKVKAHVYKRKKNYAEAEIDELLEPSSHRTDPRCFYFPTCGGCTRQHVEYGAQLEAKRQSVEGAFIQHTGGVPENIEVQPTLAAENEYFYRNKMAFNFSAQRWLTPKEIATDHRFDKNFALGLHPAGKPFKVIDLDECHLQSELSQRIVNEVRSLAKEHDWRPWHIRKHKGFLRHLVIRTGEQTGDVMINVVTNGFSENRMHVLADHLKEHFPEITTLVNTISTDVAQTEYGEEERILYGPGVIHDKIGPHTFEIAPTAFFQTNTRQAERLYDVARDFADVHSDDLLYDLYSGAGTISIYMAEDVEQVVGLEMMEDAVENARENAKANGVDNATFVAGDMRDVFTADFVDEYGKPDVLIVDPPRAGMHKKVVAQIAQIGPERFVYVSCNPQTQARDISLLGDAYKVEAIQPVDMFPQTHHVENVVKLTRTT